MTKNRRWIKSVIAASAAATPAMPWARSNRRRPAACSPTRAVPAQARLAAR